MSVWKGLRVRLRGWFRRGAVDREVREELEWHVAMETRKRIGEGLSPAEARRAALVALGGVERHVERHRDVRGMRGVERLWQDLRYTAGSLRRSPVFTFAAVLTLALGIGANSAAFGVVSGLLHRPPAGVGDPDGLYRVQIVAENQMPDGDPYLLQRTSYPEYRDLRRRTQDLEQLAAYRPRSLILGEGAAARWVPALTATANYFAVLGTEPALGRFWGGDDDRLDDVVVLGHDFWVRELGGDPEVLGRTVRVSDLSLVVIGVAPRHFRGVDLGPVDLFVPLGVEPRLGSDADDLEARNVSWLQMVGRIAADASVAATAERATSMLLAIHRDHPEGYGGENRFVDLAPVTRRFGGFGPENPVPVWLLGVSAVILLVACANVSNLLLARAAGRRRELAVRAAFGASGRRLVQLLLVESLVLALLGAVAGLAVAAAASRLLPVLDLPPIDPLVDGRVLAFSISVALLTTVLVGLVPALRASRTDVEQELKATTPRATWERSRLRSGLTVAQVTLSLVLVVNALLFVRSLRNVAAAAGDFDADHIAVVAHRFAQGTSDERMLEVKQQALVRLRTTAGIASAEITSEVPYASGIGISYTGLGLDEEARHQVIPLDVGPGYFGIFGLELRAGRLLDATDVLGSPPVALINETLAGLFGGAGEALGRCVPGRGGVCAEIVGVVTDSRFMNPVEDGYAAKYQPIAQSEYVRLGSNARLVARTDLPVRELAASLRAAVQSPDAAVQLVEVESVADLLRPDLQPWRVASSIFLVFGALAFVLAALGLYSVIAYLVASRTHELGLRVVLGARPITMFGTVVGEGAALAGLGVALGLPLAYVASRLLEHRLYGVTATDVPTYVVVATLTVAVAVLASVLSGYRAVRVDPCEALRE